MSRALAFCRSVPGHDLPAFCSSSSLADLVPSLHPHAPSTFTLTQGTPLDRIFFVIALSPAIQIILHNDALFGNYFREYTRFRLVMQS